MLSTVGATSILQLAYSFLRATMNQQMRTGMVAVIDERCAPKLVSKFHCRSAEIMLLNLAEVAYTGWMS